jgi:hypothetical protein
VNALALRSRSGQSGRVRAGVALVALCLTACSSSGPGSAVGSTTKPSTDPVAAPTFTTLVGHQESSAVTSATSVPSSSDACKLGEEVYVRSGLFAHLPPETKLNLSSTADEVPHAEAGASFLIAGTTVEFWRALHYGPDAVPRIAGRLDHGVSVFVRADDPVEQACLLAGLRYDASRDID